MTLLEPLRRRKIGCSIVLGVVVGLLVYLLLVAGAAVLFARLPTAFLPDEDQGILQLQVKMPAGATTERLRASGIEADALQVGAQAPDARRCRGFARPSERGRRSHRQG